MTASLTLAEEAESESKIEVGHHIVREFFGMSFNLDTIIGTSVAALILLALAFALKAKFTTSGVPSGVQLFFEAVTKQMRGQVESSIGMKVAPFVLPLAVALFTFILISNWLAVIPSQYGHDGKAAEWLKPPASDINFVYALTLVVFVWYHAAGFRKRGIFGYPVKLIRGHGIGLAPINIIEEIAKPVSLSLRLFGNVFAGGIMVSLITLFPWYLMWGPNAVWKLFDLFVGLIQAFIFSLLTILYFSQSMESEDAH
ncbi:F0F1 ATP synthase subunit A [Williamsia sp. CHRR-6]|uniref:F0F1 ATP synthase subunit A n=1 Tax=Williamsia sp. CHRR-6 TaxID=2835871 RepID=UPI001BD9BC89|nr:F0F1 ATP synthase subunit A [Williamsia sp. CHRR-6]MBT0568423.1 F0F1 ATP synthase subunit A [Williamsia sp. CHRR-6]